MKNEAKALKIVNSVVSVLAAMAGIALTGTLFRNGGTFEQAFADPFNWILAFAAGFGIDSLATRLNRKTGV